MDSITIYHGTSKQAASDIFANGFKAGECSDYGLAVYFSPCEEWAHEYANAHKEGCIIESVFTGKILDLSIPAHFEIYKKTGKRNSKIIRRIKGREYNCCL